MQRFDPAFSETKESFETIDEDGSGSIEFGEFSGLMLEIDHARPQGALRTQFAAIDTNHDGRISLDEFRTWLGSEGR
jgi:Ca2+-binding EF-hand superfamily protein